jgi:hypothetical protein
MKKVTSVLGIPVDDSTSKQDKYDTGDLPGENKASERKTNWIQVGNLQFEARSSLQDLYDAVYAVRAVEEGKEKALPENFRPVPNIVSSLIDTLNQIARLVG